MTEKRFVDYFDKDHNYIIQDLQNEDKYQVGFVNCDEDVFLELINRLSDENEKLKQRITTQSVDREQLCKRIDEVRKENEQLKEEIKDLNDVLARYEEKELEE